ncbi:MAG: ArgE/DapE family deacylase [Candidatus Heimdallarchaeota archaeon]
MGVVRTHVNETETVELLKRLVSINSVNPSLVKGAPGEAEIAEFVADFLQGLGLEMQVDEIEPGRPNVIGILKGADQGPKLMLNGHLDTVGIDYMEIDPLDPVVKKGKLFGRGANDMKSGLAAILAATKAVADSNVILRGDLIVAAVCDEEYASIGTDRLMEQVTADAAIVGEPTRLQILIAHKGFAWIDVETRGVAAHGSRWQIGVDAIAKMGKVLVELETLQNDMSQRKGHTLVGPPSVHASVIQGGLELSTYPDYCKLQVERRLIPGEDSRIVDAEMKSILTSLSKTDSKFNGRYQIKFVRGPMEVSPDEKICQVLHRNILEATGNKPQFIGSAGWLDSEIICKRGIPVVAFGPRGIGSHAAVEYVELDSVIDAAKILERVITQFCESVG